MELDLDTFDLKTHNGTLTVENPETGGHRTLRIRTQPKDSKFAPGERVAALLTGPDNTGDFRGFAFVNADGSVALWRKKRTPAFETYVDMLQRPKLWAETRGIRYHVEGRCRVCNRKLTTVESVTLGIGPKCGGGV